MTKEKELTLPTDWPSLKEQATTLVKSGFLPQSIKTPEQAIAVAIAGRELGIGIMEACRSINIIQGKPTISPQLMLAMANRTGELEDIAIDSNDERCVVTVKRKGRQPHTVTFGVKEATALGLMGRDNYIKQRATMFQWRAVGANLRVSFADVMLGFYTPEEMGADVRVGESGAMEVVSLPESEDMEEVDTGVRVPKKFWDTRKKDPSEAQKIIGEGFYPKKAENCTHRSYCTGWHIFGKQKKGEKIVLTPPIEDDAAGLAFSDTTA